MNGSASKPSSATMKWHPLRHEPGDEGDISWEAIKLSDYDRALTGTTAGQRCATLGDSLKSDGRGELWAGWTTM